MRKKKTVEERFWEKVDKTPGHGPNGDCWIWTVSIDKIGYGRFSLKGASTYAHRVAYLLQFAEIINELNVCHRCDWPSCVNPDHLFLDTQADNMKDRDSKGRGQSGKAGKRKRARYVGQNWCTDCLQYKPIQDFHFNHKGLNGRGNICKPCRHIRAIKRRKRKIDKETILIVL